eukprot:1701137-Amphidinium_carterae.1
MRPCSLPVKLGYLSLHFGAQKRQAESARSSWLALDDHQRPVCAAGPSEEHSMSGPWSARDNCLD